MAALLEEGLDAVLDLRLQAVRSLGGLVEADDEVDEKLGVVPRRTLGGHDVDAIVGRSV